VGVIVWAIMVFGIGRYSGDVYAVWIYNTGYTINIVAERSWIVLKN